MNVPETFFSVREQLILFGISCLCGGALGIFYDIFRAVRVIFPHNTWLIVIEDVIFMSGCAVLLTAFTSAAARGEFRFYYIIGSAVGFILYFLTVGNAVIAALKKLFALISGLLRVIIRPLNKIYVFLRKKAGLKFVGNSKFLVKSVKNVKSLLLKQRNLLYNNKDNKKERT